MCFRRRKMFSNPKNAIWFKSEKIHSLRNNKLSRKRKNIILSDEIVYSKSVKKSRLRHQQNIYIYMYI